MNETKLQSLLACQRRYYASGATLSYASRMHGLKLLKDAIEHHEKDLAAGNTVILKPSAYAPASSEILKNAAQHLTPVTLELGGKSPCIVERSAKLGLAARRIVFGKFLNCGQTCVAPDYILCDEHIRDTLADAIRREIIRQFGANPLHSPDYGKIINQKHFDRILGLINREKLFCGGEYNEKELRIAPTVLKDATFHDAAMQEEIFGPVLPILTFRSLEEAINAIESRPRPLALYLFSEDTHAQRQVLSRCRFGGGCINDTVIHFATSAMPFGGVGESGMGCYHGKDGFLEFSHTRSIVDKKPGWISPYATSPTTGQKNPFSGCS